MKRSRAMVLAWAVIAGAGVAEADDGVRLHERFAAGHRYSVRSRVDLSGTLTPPPVKGKTARAVKVEGTSQIDYEERVLTVDDRGQVSKTLRVFEKLAFRRTVAGQPQELSLRSTVRRQVLLRKGHTEVPFSPDGPLTWGEIDAVRTDVFTPALSGLLPSGEVRAGSTWNATSLAVRELTDLEKVDEGGLECKMERLVYVGKRRQARVTFSGTVKGVGEDGTVRHRLQGTFHFDIDGGYLADLTLQGAASLLDKDDKEVGRIDGKLILQRTPGVRAEGLSDAAIRGLKLEPDDNNTQMLYDNTDLGVRFTHSRRWKVAQVMGAQVALDTTDGNGILITTDPPEQVPTATGFLNESRQWLTKQKAKMVKSYSPKRLRDRPPLDGFALEAELGGQKLWLDYYVTTQDNGGVTVAARLLQNDLAALRREVDHIARSVTVTKRITVPKKK